MSNIEKKMEEIMAAASFYKKSGKDYSYDSDNKKVTIPCPSNPKLVVFKASDATEAVVAQTAGKDTTGAKYAAGAILHGWDLDKATLSASNEKNSMLMSFYYYGGAVVSGAEAIKLEATNEGVTFGVHNFVAEYTENGVAVPAEYTWTAYYWNE